MPEQLYMSKEQARQQYEPLKAQWFTKKDFIEDLMSKGYTLEGWNDWTNPKVTPSEIKTQQKPTQMQPSGTQPVQQGLDLWTQPQQASSKQSKPVTPWRLSVWNLISKALWTENVFWYMPIKTAD